MYLKRLEMKNYTFDFYNSASLRAYNLNDTMRFQLSILDKMDHITKRHSENVANLTCRICEYLHLNNRAIIHATMSGYLHDVGKLMVPKEILQKPDKLTDEEYEIIKTHTSKGYEICMKNPELRPYARTALCHHEALNGTGYPNGIGKKEIPFETQIVTVADEYDALVTKRHYTTHVNISETLKALIKDALPETDPKIIALDQLNINKKLGKINAKILKILFKVVIDDVYYEISCLQNYIDYLKGEIKRLETVQSYYNKMENSKKDKDKKYFLDGINLLLLDDETTDNFENVYEDYKLALENKCKQVDKLEDEIKIIRKLKI